MTLRAVSVLLPLALGACAHHQAATAVSEERPVNGYSKAEVIGAMKAIQPEVASCYERFKVPGTAIANVRVDPAGSVAAVEIAGDLANTPTAACVQQAVQKAHFRAVADAANARFSYPFRFR
jgi:hypothetical protein